MRTWLARLRRAFPRPSPPRSSRSPRLVLEALEDRRLLATGFVQSNLVSDIAGVAPTTDPGLVNPWGISFAPNGPFWISDNNAGLTTLYNGQGTPQALIVDIPSPTAPTGATGTPTGTVFNSGLAAGAFKVTDGTHTGSAIFLFATEDGTIVGWNPTVDPTGQFSGPNNASTHAVIAVDNSAKPTPANGAVYKGLAIATSAGGPIVAADANSTSLLYAANFRSGKVDVFDTTFQTPALAAGAFTDATLPAGFAPFGIQQIGGKIYVSYALQNAAKHDDVAGPGNGFVDVYNLDGSGEQRLISHGALNSPWGLALAPATFGTLGGDLLVGNFGDGTINAFNLTTGASLGPVTDVHGNPVTIDGLWGLAFGNGFQGTSTNTLYFTAGIAGESHGLFGDLNVATDKPLTGLGTVITTTEGTPFTGVVGSFTDADPAAKAADFTATITWGDGHTSPGTIAAGAGGSFTVTGTNTYALAGNDAISVLVTDTNATNDPGGSTATINSTANVADAALVAAGTTVTVPQGATAVVATFTDAGGPQAVGNYSAMINWGDGSAPTAGVITVAGTTFSVAGSHSYATPGRYNLGVTILDRGGSTATAMSVGVAGSANDRFLAQVYQGLFHHTIDPSGLAFWNGQLNAGLTRSQVVAGIENSQEFRTDEVVTLYSQLLHRVPDMAGLNNWVSFLASGGTVEQLQSMLAGSPEYFQVRGGGTAAGFITALFQDGLGRAPDAMGLASLEQLLALGGTPVQVASFVFGGPEFQQDLVRGLFQRILNRAPDANSLSFFAGSLQQGARDEALTAALMGSDEFFSHV